MKKRILTIFLASACALLCFTGCGFGNYIESGNKNPSASAPNNPGNPNNPVNPDDPSNPDTPGTPTVSSSDYVVSVYYDNKLFEPGDEEITVVWRSDYDVKRVALGADGTANAGELQGDYHIYLEGLPTTYTYNPNVYTATATERKITLLLTTIRSPESGDGGGLYRSDGCYRIRFDGTYRAKLNSGEKVLYYEYQPQEAGWYSLESWVNVYENEINPVLDTYIGTQAWKRYEKSIDGGGFSLTGGYTKNFRYDYYIDKTEVGHSFTFAIHADSRLDEYPVNVDFAIRYEGEYSNGYSNVKIIKAENATKKADNRKPGQTFKYADMASYIYDMKNYKLNPKTGYYHRYDEIKYASNDGYGPELCCMIDASIPSYRVCRLYNADKQGLGGGSNWLKIGMVWDEEENRYATYDYTDFIKEDYKNVCNSDGVCYVTEELKQFLQRYAEAQMLWTDGVLPQDGRPEKLGYYAKQDALWLFACGFYE